MSRASWAAGSGTEHTPNKKGRDKNNQTCPIAETSPHLGRRPGWGCRVLCLDMVASNISKSMASCRRKGQAPEGAAEGHGLGEPFKQSHPATYPMASRPCEGQRQSSPKCDRSPTAHIACNSPSNGRTWLSIIWHPIRQVEKIPTDLGAAKMVSTENADSITEGRASLKPRVYSVH